jgi:hypothetical protein
MADSFLAEKDLAAIPVGHRELSFDLIDKQHKRSRQYTRC